VADGSYQEAGDLFFILQTPAVGNLRSAPRTKVKLHMRRRTAYQDWLMKNRGRFLRFCKMGADGCFFACQRFRICIK
jgi:hypothetical protein